MNTWSRRRRGVIAIIIGIVLIPTAIMIGSGTEYGQLPGGLLMGLVGYAVFFGGVANVLRGAWLLVRRE
jgi:cytosine/uracil/thiamine/allantoin permease